mmetsp:Transcript_21044/g.45057  ORF Transcript_21044/g.45057 Transcript_21044/m.45057 type:complete len:247 (-) Transcript_21044:537-1277(-)
MSVATWSRPSPTTMRLRMLTMTLSMSLMGFHPSLVRSSMQSAPLMTKPVCFRNRGLTTRTNGGSKGYWSGKLIWSSTWSMPQTRRSLARLDSSSNPKSLIRHFSILSSSVGSSENPASTVSAIIILYRSEARRRRPPVFSFSARRDMFTAARVGSRHFCLRPSWGLVSGTAEEGEEGRPPPTPESDAREAARLMVRGGGGGAAPPAPPPSSDATTLTPPPPTAAGTEGAAPPFPASNGPAGIRKPE